MSIDGGFGRYETTELADQDILEIALYLARQSGMETADRFADRLQEVFALLAQSPQMGRRRDDLAPRLRSFPVGSYVVFYQAVGAGVLIIRVLHGARDLPPLFGGPEMVE